MMSEEKQIAIEELLKLIELKEKDIEGLEAGENIDGDLDYIIKESKKELATYKKELEYVKNAKVQIPDIEKSKVETVNEVETEKREEIIEESEKWTPVSVKGDIKHLKEKVKLIKECKAKNQEIIDSLSTTESQKVNAQVEIDNINANIEELKLEIAKEAFEKTKVEYNGEPIKPTELFGIYSLEKIKLEKERDELKEKVENQTKRGERQKSERKVQYEIAKEKYKQLLKNGKITEELYEKRIENMANAMTKDNLSYEEKISSLNEKLNDVNDKLVKVNESIKEVSDKIELREEYKKIYADLYGEDLIIEDIQVVHIQKNKGQNVQGASVPKFTESKIAESNQPGQEKQEIEKEEPQQIETKKQFNKLYKKLKKGSITKQEVDGLTKALENAKNYDKFGISTGLIFNKSKKILELSADFLANDMESFIKENSKFAEGINYDEEVENGEIFYTAGELRSWFKESELGETSNPKFGVEEYIARIEEYKKNGNDLNANQNKQYNEAMKLKEKIEGYRKSLKSHRNISLKRSKEGILNKLFAINESTQILPETNQETVVEKPKELEFAETLEDSVREEVNIVETEVADKNKEGQIIDEEIR
ncbi:MAG: hypothetical protein PHR25_01685 [Clostridia bacterium]|nr:hypothetical protein [Clostridia bacterium]MDD4375473.1 hypothetical protein [Clostridia bacterium]